MASSKSNPAKAKCIKVHGVGTNYHDEGEGPPVVLLHGSGQGVSAWSNWRNVLPVLSSKFRVIAPDIPGFGYTDRSPDVKFEMGYWTRHLLGFLDELGIKKASFVGNSFGGGLTLSLVQAAPDRVERMVLMGSGGVTFKVTPGLLQAWDYEPSIDNMRALLTNFVFDKSLITDDLVKERFLASAEPGANDVFEHMVPREFRKAEMILPGIPKEVLAGIPHETLVIHGRDDEIVPVANSVKLNERIPNSDLHVFGNCGHWVQFERRDRFCRLVADQGGKGTGCFSAADG